MKPLKPLSFYSPVLLFSGFQLLANPPPFFPDPGNNNTENKNKGKKENKRKKRINVYVYFPSRPLACASFLRSEPLQFFLLGFSSEIGGPARGRDRWTGPATCNNNRGKRGLHRVKPIALSSSSRFFARRSSCYFPGTTQSQHSRPSCAFRITQLTVCIVSGVFSVRKMCPPSRPARVPSGCAPPPPPHAPAYPQTLHTHPNPPTHSQAPTPKDDTR